MLFRYTDIACEEHKLRDKCINWTGTMGKKINKFLRPSKAVDEITIHNIKWYPSSQSCVRTGIHSTRPNQIPPLMVRKAAWRR